MKKKKNVQGYKLWKEVKNEKKKIKDTKKHQKQGRK